MMLRGIGDVASSCGANPCGFMDSLFPSAACDTWQVCAASVDNASGGVSVGPCVPGGLDANGNTIVSCGGQDAEETPYPIITDAPCTGMTPEQCAAVSQPLPGSVGVPQWALLGGVVFVLAMLVVKR